MSTVASPSPSPSPSSAVRARRGRGWRITGVVLGIIVVGVAACEVAGWPFLVGPVQNELTKVLNREFYMQQPTDGGPHATLRFFGHLRVYAPKIHIAAPAWSQQPFFLEADNARLTVTYAALWRAHDGGALDIRRLEADKLVTHAERRADGSASWQFGDPSKPAVKKDTATPMPTIRELVLRDGTATYVDVPLKVDVTAKVSTSEGVDAGSRAQGGTTTPPARAGLQASATGTYAGLPFNASLHAPGAQALLVSGPSAPAIPLLFDMKAGGAALAFQGTVTDITQFADITGAVQAKGGSLSAIGDKIGVTLPSTGDFDIKGRIAKTGKVYNFVSDDATVGSSKMNAALTFDASTTVPKLSGRVGGPRFFLVDLLPSVGAAPVSASTTTVSGPVSAQVAAKQEAIAKAEEQKVKDKKAKDKEAKEKKAREGEDSNKVREAKVLPDKQFDLPSLRAMNANVLFAFDRAELGSAFNQPIQPLKAHLTLQDGRLLISDIDARTADGNVGGSLGLDGTGTVGLYRARLNWSGVRLERWLKQPRSGDAPPYISGRVSGRAELEGKGKSTADILGSLDGTIMTSLQNGKISHLVLEGSGIDIAQAVGMLIKGDDALPLNCAVVDLASKNGTLTPRTFVMDTDDSLINVDGTLSLQTEALNLRAVVTPKDFTPMALRSPILVKGTFGDPAISLEKTPIAKRVGAAVLLGLINPLAALIPLIDPGDKDAKTSTGCATLLQRARKDAAVAAAKS